MHSTFKRLGVLTALLFALCLVFALSTTAMAETGTCGTCTWEIDSEGTLTIKPTNGTSGTLISGSEYTDWPWNYKKVTITKVVVEKGVKAGNSLRCAFYHSGSLTSADLSNLDTSATTDMSRMFMYCDALTSVDLSSFNTSSVTDMYGMFAAYDEDTNMLTTIYVDPDKWDTNAVANSTDMFDGCTCIKGGAGTNYDGAYTDKAYAHVDGGPGNPGYLTARFNVEFDGNGATSGAMAHQAFAPNTEQTLTKNAFVKEGATFLGWATNKSATMPEYSDEQSMTVGAGMTLFAVWKADTPTPEPTPAPVPTTGDSTPIALTAGLLVLSGIALVALKKRTAR